MAETRDLHAPDTEGTAGEAWSVGDEYEGYVGRWSARVAEKFVAWLALPAGGRWVDVGCGTGALTSAILELAAPGQVVGFDPSSAYVDFARARFNDERVSLRVGAADRVPAGLRDFDAVVSGLVLNFVPAPGRAVAAMSRAARVGGTVAAYVWDYAGEMQLMRYFWDAASELFPAARQLDEGQRFASFQPKRLAALFRERLVDVSTTALVVPTPFASFADYWTPFLGGQGPAPGFAFALDEDDQARLRELIRSRLPMDDDGSIALTARAWAVRGRRAE